MAEDLHGGAAELKMAFDVGDKGGPRRLEKPAALLQRSFSRCALHRPREAAYRGCAIP